MMSLGVSPSNSMTAKVGWSVGTFGAIAEFVRDRDEDAVIDHGGNAKAMVTARGGLRVENHPALRLIATESLTSKNWSHRIALCLPEDGAMMNRRTCLTEIGPDTQALRDEDRNSILFDLGLDALQIDACVRTGDADVIAALRQRTGKPVFAPDSGAMAIILAANPHRVFISRIGRVEVFQPIPPPDGKSPEGPHTHVLPKLLRARRTHAATEPIPPGWIPCAHFYPPHPLRDAEGRSHAFESGRHEKFQALLSRYGLLEQHSMKSRVIDAIAAGAGPVTEMPEDRLARATMRIALRQLQASGANSDALAAWISTYDRADLEDLSGAEHH